MVVEGHLANFFEGGLDVFGFADDDDGEVFGGEIFFGEGLDLFGGGGGHFSGVIFVVVSGKLIEINVLDALGVAGGAFEAEEVIADIVLALEIDFFFAGGFEAEAGDFFEGFLDSGSGDFVSGFGVGEESAPVFEHAKGGGGAVSPAMFFAKILEESAAEPAAEGGVEDIEFGGIWAGACGAWLGDDDIGLDGAWAIEEMNGEAIEGGWSGHFDHGDFPSFPLAESAKDFGEDEGGFDIADDGEGGVIGGEVGLVKSD